MKKILALLGITILSAGTSFAYILEDETANINTLQTQGYSLSTLQIIDTVKSLNQGPNGKYKRHFTRKSESPYSTLKLYVDPIQDDGEFAQHEINFTNTWKGNETRYSSSKEAVENL